jgi:hypothetical protein
VSAVERLPAGLIDRGRELSFQKLQQACVIGDLELVAGFLATGIPADTYSYTEDEGDETALVWLAGEDWLEPGLKIAIAQMLLANGAGVDEGEPLEIAEEMRDEPFARFLGQSGATASTR